MRQADALLQYHLGIEPDSLSDDNWARKVKELEWARQEESKINDRHVF